MSSVKLELLSLLLLAFAASQEKPARPVFTDVTKQAGISFKHCLGDDEISSIVEATGSEEKIQAILELLRPLGIKEIVRTGKVAMHRGLRHVTVREGKEHAA